MKKFIKQTKWFWKQTVLLAVLAFLLSVAGAALLPIRAEAAVQSGVIGTPDADGNQLSWTYDEDTKTLTISGTGELGTALSEEPFQSMEIKKVAFEDGCKVTGSMAEAFGGATISKVEEIDFTGLDISEVTSMSNMFAQCSNLTTLDLSSFDTSSVTDMGYMFWNCQSLETLDLSSFDTASVTGMGGMFWNCQSLKTLDLSSFDTTSVTDMGGMFIGCHTLETLDLSSFDTASVTDMGGMFRGCQSLETLDLSSFDTASVTDMGYMFHGCESLKTLDLSSFDTASVTGMGYMFYWCQSLETLDLSSFDTASVTDMGGMFQGCGSLETLDLSSFDTANVTSMYLMFGCHTLKTLDLSSFDTTNVTSMECMFIGCHTLETLDLSGFDTANVTSMACMFENCTSLETLDLSGFDTANVTSMMNMFYWCTSLKTLDLSRFDTANVTSMMNMFYWCTSLKTLDLSSFDISDASIDVGIIDSCRALEEIKAPHAIAEGWQAELPAVFYDADIYEGSGEYRTMTAMDVSCAGKTLKKYGDYDVIAEPFPDAVQYVMYEHIIPNAGGLAQGMRLLEGTLPAGMEIQADGKLCGIPTEAGEFVFTIEVAAQTVSGGDGSTFGVPKTYKLTVSNNSDAHVNATTDQGYEILQPIPDFTGDSVSDYTLVSEGDYDEFREVYIDGVKLKAGEDYTSEAGSTHINIKSGTMERFSGAGIHTILVEFRAAGTNELKCAVQNYRVAVSSDDGRGEGSTGNDNIGSDNGDDSGSDSGDAGGSDNGGDGSGSTDDDGSDDGSSTANQNSKTASTPIKYMVVRGDVLGRIARRNGVSLAQLLAWNPQIKNPGLIFPGQVLVVGYIGGSMEAPALQAQEGAVVDVVQKGDSLYGIAVRNGVGLDKVAALNPELMKQKYIYPGQKVRVK